MYRNITNKFIKWKKSKFRKPLIVRGARQVGKTYSIKDFGKNNFNNLLVFDFEKEKSLHKIFERDLNVKKIIMELEIHAGKRISMENTLIFFDEIQSCPRALLSLRYFFEDMNEIYIIAAGSLLEFAMGDLSFPVGRVEFEWMRPMSFTEFLLARKKDLYLEYFPTLETQNKLTETLHEKIMEELRLYLIVGGMPEAVKRFVNTHSLREAADVHRSLSQAYFQSFLKYLKRVDIESLEYILFQIPKQVGNQIKYTKIDPEQRIQKTKASLQILERALIINRVNSTFAQGLPLGANVSSRIFKAIFLDIGFMQHLCGINPNLILQEKDLLNIYKGRLAEQFVGQELLVNNKGSENDKLYYWSRQKKSSSAEVDYLIVRNGKIYPIEVKSGPAGKLKSMHLIMKENNACEKGIVLSSTFYKKNEFDNLIFLPLYSFL